MIWWGNWCELVVDFRERIPASARYLSRPAGALSHQFHELPDLQEGYILGRESLPPVL